MTDDKKRDKINMFNNPMIESALKALTPEQLKEYEQIGKYMFKTNFTDEKQDPEKEMNEAIFYIKEGLKSGVHPEDLKAKELQIMYELYGDKWYEEYGYYQDEVPPNPSLHSGLVNKPSIKNPSKKMKRRRRNRK